MLWDGRALDEVSGLTGERIPGLTGVWVGGQKVAAIGVRAQKWVTYHGLAVNITTDLTPFRYITPCGIADRPVASVQVRTRVLADVPAPVHAVGFLRVCSLYIADFLASADRRC